MKASTIERIVKMHFADEMREIRGYVAAALWDLNEGPRVAGEGFETLCGRIRTALRDMGAKDRVWVSEECEVVATREPSWREDGENAYDWALVEDCTCYLVGRELAGYVR